MRQHNTNTNSSFECACNSARQPASQPANQARAHARKQPIEGDLNLNKMNDANASSLPLQSLVRIECVTQAIQPSLLTQNFEVI